MKEFEFRKKWTEEKPVYKAWGDFVVNKVLEILKDSQIDAGSFFLKSRRAAGLKMTGL